MYLTLKVLSKFEAVDINSNIDFLIFSEKIRLDISKKEYPDQTGQVTEQLMRACKGN